MFDIGKWEALLYSIVAICITVAFVLTDGCNSAKRKCDCTAEKQLP